MIIERVGPYTVITNYPKYEVAVSGIRIGICNTRKEANNLVRFATSINNKGVKK